MDNQNALTSFYWLFNFISACLVLFYYEQRYVKLENCHVFRMCLVLKLLAGVTSAYIFMFHFDYTTDIQTYFFQSKVLLSNCIDHPDTILETFIQNRPAPEINYVVMPRAYFFIKILAVLNLLTGSNFWLDAAWLSLFSFLSIWYLAHKLERYLAEAFYIFILAFCCVPTTVFWSSGMFKESICLGLLAIIIAHFIQLLNGEFNAYKGIVSLLLMYVLFQIKFYFLGTFLLISIPVLLNRASNSIFKIQNDVYKCGLFLFFLTVISLIANYISIKIFTIGVLDLIYNNHIMFSERGKVDFFFDGLKEFDPKSFLAYIPESLWQGLFMPLPTSNQSFFECVESITNGASLILVIVASTSLLLRGKNFPKFDLQLIGLMVLFVVISALAIGFSTPNWGTLARYKIMYMPFLHAMCLSILTKEPLIRRISARF